MLRKRLVVLLAGVVVVVAPVFSGAAAAVVAPAASTARAMAADSPAATIDALDAALLKAMQGGSRIGYSGRYRIIAPVVQRVFDYSRIASLTLGSYWSKLSPGQQKEFVGVLADYTAATYAARFDSDSGARFAIVSTQTLHPGTEGVFSTFTERNGKVHRFVYLLQKQDGRWGIVNVVADGVSDLSLKRAEYTETMKNKGFSALVAHLRKQIAGYAKGAH